ncbi:MAG: hypothetical protein PHV17_05540, partial [Candidatus Omnitrophica bacterium]|nr:hypothetical protein [Candidatus Omnitrophota bacterium]
PVGKDLVVIYNISIDAVNAGGIGKEDTIYSRCALYRKDTGGGWDGPFYFPIETRTPIMSQPHISNVVVIPSEGQFGGKQNAEIIAEDMECRVVIQWYKDTPAGDIRIRGANVIVVAVEPRP